MKERRAAGRRKGGVRRSKGLAVPVAVFPPGTPDYPLRSVDDVVAHFERCVNAVGKGLLDPRVGNCIFVGMGYQLRALQTSDLEAQVAAEEARTSALEARMEALLAERERERQR
jgi:hypothetical protein